MTIIFKTAAETLADLPNLSASELRRRRYEGPEWTRQDTVDLVRSYGDELVHGPSVYGGYWYSVCRVNKQRPWRLMLWRHGRPDTQFRSWYATRTAAVRAAKRGIWMGPYVQWR